MKQVFKTVADSNNWHERGELPPVGTECEAKIKGARSDFRKIKPVFFGNECFIACDITNGLEIHGVISDWTFRPIQPKPKKIDISMFAGTDIWMGIAGDPKCAIQAKRLENLEGWEPIPNVWNAVKGLTEEPEWCEPFNVTARYWNGEEKYLVGYINWPDVVAISFDSVKEGFEL